MSIRLSKFAEPSTAPGQATYGMSNLRSTTTGLPFIVFISQRDGAKHAAQVKWSPEPRIDPKNMGSYSVSPFEFKAGRKLSSAKEKLLERRVAINKDVLVDYWNGDIPYTEDAVGSLKKTRLTPPLSSEHRPPRQRRERVGTVFAEDGLA